MRHRGRLCIFAETTSTEVDENCLEKTTTRDCCLVRRSMSYALIVVLAQADCAQELFTLEQALHRMLNAT